MSYVACAWAPSNPRAADRVRRFQKAVEDPAGGRWRHPQPGLAVLSLHPIPLAVRPLAEGRGAVIGDIHPRPGHGVWIGRPGSRTAGSEAWARDLLACTWGPYVAILRDKADGSVALYREPSGALDCITWRDTEVTFVAGDLPPCLRAELPSTVVPDWERIAAMVIDPRLMAGALGLQGVQDVAPGTLLRADGQVLALWTPAKAARRPAPTGPQARLALPDLVDGCVERLSGGRRIVAELSGGLDSAIVAAALCRSPNATVAAWINYHPEDFEADERRAAQGVADHLGVRLSLAPKPDQRLDPDRLRRRASAARPSLNLVDADYDDDLADRCRALGAQAIFTGQGGDTVFFQPHTPLVAADALLRDGPRSWFASPLLGDVARWTRRSIWGVAGACGLALARGPASPKRPRPAIVAPGVIGRQPAWTTDTGGLPPGKRRQIEGLAQTQLFLGACARTRAVRLVHPLLSTPIVDYLLAVSAVDLTAGGRDRALARRAFADRLPPSVAARRTKASMTAYYGRMLGAGLDQLRPWLLEGALAQRGLLDRQALDRALTAEALMWRGGYRELMGLSVIQAWAETWL